MKLADQKKKDTGKKHEYRILHMKKWFLCAVPGLLIMAAALFLMTHWNIWKEKKAAPDLVILGDSIMGKEREDQTIPSVIEKVTGLTVFNGAFGGSCACSNNFENRYSFHEDSLNLCRLQDAIVHQDFGVQLADLPNNPYQSAYFPEVLQGLSEIDFSRVKVLLIEHGTNDYTAGRKLDNPDNPKDSYTFGGALRLSISNIQKAYPNLKIILVSPKFCWIPGYKDCTKQDFGHGTMQAYVDLEKKIAEDYGLDLIDVFDNTGFNADNIREYTEDGLHLNEDGRTIYGTYIGKQLKKILNI